MRKHQEKHKKLLLSLPLSVYQEYERAQETLGLSISELLRQSIKREIQFVEHLCNMKRRAEQQEHNHFLNNQWHRLTGHE
jgi:hypothetical protein